MRVEATNAGGRLELERLGMVFSQGDTSVEALRDVNVSIDPGEFVSVLGPSGCGKSTLLAAIAGLRLPSFGKVSVDGLIVEKPGPERAMVFQHHTLMPWKTVAENVEFGLKQRGTPRQERRAAVAEILRRVDLEDFSGHFPAQLSGGMQQRVNLARALVNRPRILLMDEPFAALDAQTRLLMQELLLELWEESRMTVIFVTHDIDEALFLSDRVILLSRRPAQVRAELSVELPRPRDAAALTHPEFVRKKRECLEQLRAEVGATRRHATNGEARCPGCHVSHDRFS